MTTPEIILVTAPVLLLAWANGANDVSKGVATLIGSGACGARRALRFGTLCAVLGGLAGIAWGGALAVSFGSGFLVPGYRPDTPFVAGAVSGAFGWLALATRLGLPVSTTHALLGGILGAALAAVGLEGLRLGAVAHHAAVPLLLSPLMAIALCWALLLVSRRVAKRLPLWQAGCCDPEEWRADPFRCAPPQDPTAPGARRVLRVRHWLSAGATSFARGLNDVPKMAAFLILAFGAAPSGGGAWLAAFALVTLAMAAGSLWAGRRVAHTLAHRVTRLDPAQGLTANVGTAALVLAASPLGLPVSTTHVASGALLGIRVADRCAPETGDALKIILLAWVITLPAAAAVAAVATFALARLG